MYIYITRYIFYAMAKNVQGVIELPLESAAFITTIDRFPHLDINILRKKCLEEGEGVKHNDK